MSTTVFFPVKHIKKIVFTRKYISERYFYKAARPSTFFLRGLKEGIYSDNTWTGGNNFEYTVEEFKEKETKFYIFENNKVYVKSAVTVTLMGSSETAYFDTDEEAEDWINHIQSISDIEFTVFTNE